MTTKNVALSDEQISTLERILDSHISLGLNYVGDCSLHSLRSALRMPILMQGGKLDRRSGDVDFDIRHTGSNKVVVIKLLRQITGFGLKESKDIVDASDYDLGGVTVHVINSTHEEFYRSLELLRENNQSSNQNVNIYPVRR